jgi:DNA (cytosine-5)-methyltransferase 1
MRFGSVCSGIEAASVAWHPLGWKAAWLSEIEPFPSAALAHHYPAVPNLGDMTALPERIASGEVEAPDLFCGGTPCQAFSVAGLRKSLDDDRGNLSLTFVEIANAIDKRRLDAGHVPAIIFWENVPGVLNTKDNAFGCFLGALAGEDEPLIAPGGRWSNAGCVYGPQRAVAWRVLDAQYFGVAQRRRRVFVVASARDDFDPAAVLFESEGVRRDTAPSREERKEVTECAGTLTANGGGLNRPAGNANELDFCVTASRMVAFGEYVEDGTASAMKARDYKDATDLVAQPVAFGAQMSNPQTDVDLSQTLQAKNPAAVAFDGYNQTLSDTSQTIRADKSDGDHIGMVMHPVIGPSLTAMQVRRLTPVEYERLQGFPDGYTNIPWRKADESPDGPRYKALGNSWAVPVVRWIGKRIQEAVHHG